MALHYAIDSVAVNGRMLFGWGWCFSDQAAHADVQLKLECANGTVVWLKCQSHITRVDVLTSYPSSRHSVSSGFRFSATLNPDLANAKVSLYLMMHDGSWENISVPDFLPAIENENEKKRSQKNLKIELRDFFEGLLSNASPISLLIDHAMGGGANIVSERWSREWLAAGNALLSLRFNASRLAYELQYQCAEESRSISVSDFKKLAPYLDKIRFTGIEVNSLVSYPDVFAILKFIIRQKTGKDLSLKYHVHDFHSLCDSWSLLNQHEIFCELPAPSVCNKCIASRSGVFPALSELRGIKDWRAQWKKFLAACDGIQFFSDSSRLMFERVYKGALPSSKYRVRPHESLPLPLYSVYPVSGNPFVIGVVGNISIAKGANILRDMARLILKEQLPLKIVVIGNVETYEPSEAYFSTGSYLREELPGLLEKHEVGICFLPSICPETFSFVASEVMQLQFPLACFNLGAQAERIAAYDRGFIIDEPTAESALRRILKIIEKIKAGSSIFVDPIKIENNPAGVVEA